MSGLTPPSLPGAPFSTVQTSEPPSPNRHCGAPIPPPLVSFSVPTHSLSPPVYLSLSVPMAACSSSPSPCCDRFWHRRTQQCHQTTARP
ncbi:hypothetical protein E2562_029735 [Oryza meyeriana var. granulata]|uniref:Uncharacterized protein n=1 Tax=Oryza meyeriana var. granulata TaxID=110450 RepID=A0A6G1EQY0_9ORYZ|nr:hypothetical protein E2562_029735 [Oryza meyeriana var. granulata]